MNSPLSSCRVLVLAAGRGRRMGGPKAMMMVEGKPWWRHQWAALEGLGIPVLWVVSPEVREGMGADVPECVVADSGKPMFVSLVAGVRGLERGVAGMVSQAGLKPVVDGNPPPGPLPLGGGVKAPGAFVLPVDCPAAAPEVWEALAATGEVAFPTHGGENGHPIYLPWGFVSETLLPAADSGDLGGLRLDHLIKPVARAVPVDDAAVAINLNTPDDVRSWLAGRRARA